MKVKSQRRILLIDDDPVILEILTHHLKGLGMELVTCLTSKEALRKIETEKFSGIISDLNLPDIHGLEILKKVRAYAWDTPFVICSGTLTSEHLLEGLRLGAIDFFEKPVKKEQLQQVMMRISEIGKRRIQMSVDLEKLKFEDNITERTRLYNSIVKNLETNHLFQVYNNDQQSRNQ